MGTKQSNDSGCLWKFVKKIKSMGSKRLWLWLRFASLIYLILLLVLGQIFDNYCGGNVFVFIVIQTILCAVITLVHLVKQCKGKVQHNDEKVNIASEHKALILGFDFLCILEMFSTAFGAYAISGSECGLREIFPFVAVALGLVTNGLVFPFTLEVGRENEDGEVAEISRACHYLWKIDMKFVEIRCAQTIGWLITFIAVSLISSFGVAENDCSFSVEWFLDGEVVFYILHLIMAVYFSTRGQLYPLINFRVNVILMAVLVGLELLWTIVGHILILMAFNSNCDVVSRYVGIVGLGIFDLGVLLIVFKTLFSIDENKEEYAKAKKSREDYDHLEDQMQDSLTRSIKSAKTKAKDVSSSVSNAAKTAASTAGSKINDMRTVKLDDEEEASPIRDEENSEQEQEEENTEDENV